MRELFDTLCEYAVQIVGIPAHNSSRQQRRPWTLHSWWSVCIEHVNLRNVTVGGVAQWLGRQSSAGELSLIYA